MWPANALREWTDFYLLVGTAGATLVALLFVAVSLGTGFLTRQRAAATRTFFSPVVVHFAAVFAISAVALMPAHRPVFYASLIGGCALVGAVVSLFTIVEMLRHKWTEYMEDQFAYGLLPLAGYIALLFAASMIFREREWSLDVLACALLVLLVVNIRNAWDLTLDMVRRHSRED
jgi:hypothetical protein